MASIQSGGQVAFHKSDNQLNPSFSVYFFWSYHSASKDAYDFETGAHNIQRLFDMAKQAGLWVIARPGPYVNVSGHTRSYL